MRLCVISDTHIPDRAAELPRPLIDDIKASDKLIHAGDFTTPEAFDMIRGLHSDLVAVCGNIDEMKLAEKLERTVTLDILGFKVGVIHGFGKGESVLDNVRKEFDASYHLVIFGHAHTPCETKIGKTIFFNPGSPTDTIFAPYNSYGIIEIDKEITTRIIRL